MLRCISKTTLLITLLSLLTPNVFANDGTQSKAAPSTTNLSSDKRYVQFGLGLNEFKDVSVIMTKTDSILEEFEEDGFFTSYDNLTAHTYGASIAVGWYLTDSFKTEWRAGRGIHSDKLRETYEINIDHWFNWYLGLEEQITEDISGHILFGLSSYEADVKRYEIAVFQEQTQTTVAEKVYIQPSPYRNQKGLFGTNFSISWMLGLNFKLNKDWSLVMEYGRLLKDTDTDIEVHQAGTYLKYEF